jgi:hypothetical protein
LGARVQRLLAVVGEDIARLRTYAVRLIDGGVFISVK